MARVAHQPPVTKGRVQMNRTRASVIVVISIVAAVVIVGIVAAARIDGVDVEPHLTDMQASAAGLETAGATMERHGQQMLDQAEASGDEKLRSHGEHWLSDGQALIERGQWLAMNPTAPGNLNTSPAELSRTGNLTELTRRTQQMLHDPSNARGIDIEALRLNGASMQAEGRLMIEHGQQMADDVTAMVEHHDLDATALDELRAATEAMATAGGHLEQNGIAMTTYADEISQALGR